MSTINFEEHFKYLDSIPELIVSGIKVGDKFQALYDVGQKYDNVTKQWSNIPILAEIQIIDKKKLVIGCIV